MSFHRPRRMLVFIALAFGAGVLLGVRLQTGILWLLAFWFSALLTAVCCAVKRPAWIGVLLAAFFGGVLVCSAAAHPVLPPEGNYLVQARVTENIKVREEDGRVAVYLRDAKVTDQTGKAYSLAGLYWTYWPEDENAPLPVEGQEAAFAGRIYHPSGKENPYGFDFKLYLLKQNVQAGVYGAQELALSPADQTQPGSLLLRMRKAVTERLSLLLGEDAYLASALLIGETEGMPEDMRESFRKAGVAHVLSVSGLHAMILMTVVIALLGRLSPSPRLMLGVVSSLLFAYSAFTGMEAPMIRAAILVIYQLIGRLLRRRTDPLTALAAAFITILLLWPLELFSAGFQLSFSAVLGMVMLGDRLRTYTRRIRHKALRKAASAYGVTLCASLGTALPLIYTYNSLSLVGLLVNPLVCAVMEALLPLFIVLLLLSCVSTPLAQAVGAVLAWVSRVCVQGVAYLGNLPYASVRAASIPWYVAAAFVLCLLFCTRYVRLSVRTRVATGLSALVFTCALAFATANRHVRYLQLSMGEADAAVIEDGRTTIVIDTGEHGGDLVGYLLATGRRADHLLLTHLHADHAMGLKYLLEEQVEIGCIYISTEAFKPQIAQNVLSVLQEVQEKGIAIKTLHAGDSLQTERVRVDILWPAQGAAHTVQDANDHAMALLVDLDGLRLLHMSDVTGTYELYAASDVDVLKVALHGSASSTGDSFLQRVSPRIALISGDSPSDKTLSRLANAGAMVYDTGMYGALTVTVREDAYFIEGYLQ